MKNKTGNGSAATKCVQMEPIESRNEEEKLLNLLARILAEFVLSGNGRFPEELEKVKTQYRHKGSS
ncbi:hypothetical protein WJU16_20990 [Chitinophaga pollutisoli]|uniref:Uncharacterized protein n=1 Tax=Chitinophaga pollutisoli TaxID=3133966 RepID=A0ABZ2YMQ6_9BACT